MQALTNIGTVKEILSRHGFTFSKALGQNFIVNPTVCPRIAELGGAGPGVGALEIGPGIGVLTQELACRCERVVALELDKRLLPILEETLAGFENLRVINADVLKVDLAALLAEEFAGGEVIVCANLPYYITSPILMALLEARLPVKSITVMVQKEAGRRICAPEGSRDTGAISLAVRYYSEPRMLFEVSRGSFLPAPQVDSCVIRLDLRARPPVPAEEEAWLFRVVRGAFSQRRKTAVNAISAALGRDKEQIAAALKRAGLPETVRPEQLMLEQFVQIAREIKS